jgi:hypothetical protein
MPAVSNVHADFRMSGRDHAAGTAHLCAATVSASKQHAVIDTFGTLDLQP